MSPVCGGKSGWRSSAHCGRQARVERRPCRSPTAAASPDRRGLGEPRAPRPPAVLRRARRDRGAGGRLRPGAADPTDAEIADFATAQMHYRYGLATGNDDLVAAASRTLAAVPREVFARADPRLF